MPYTTRSADDGGLGLRCRDVSVALVLAGALSPLMAAVAVVIWLSSGRPIFHRGERLGRHGEPFRIVKFRTMRQMPIEAKEKWHPITLDGDPRITRVGGLLRRYRLDELPQVFNVLRGEMAFIGPRPETTALFDALAAGRMAEILDYRPGIFSPASLTFRDEASLLLAADWQRVYLEEVLPNKVALDLAYMRTRTWRSDVRLLVRLLREMPTFGRRDLTLDGRHAPGTR